MGSAQRPSGSPLAYGGKPACSAGLTTPLNAGNPNGKAKLPLSGNPHRRTGLTAHTLWLPYTNYRIMQDIISCPVNDLLYEPSPRPLGTPLPCLGEGKGARAGYRNCLYGHDIKGQTLARIALKYLFLR